MESTAALGRISEHDAIARVMRYYIEGGAFGNSAEMRNAFHKDATIHGYVGEQLIAGPIQGLYDWVDQNGPAREMQARISSVDISGTAASVRIDAENWYGHRFTDFFHLVKFDGEWKIISKIFHLHS